jgi:hypothetical protein
MSGFPVIVLLGGPPYQRFKMVVLDVFIQSGDSLKNPNHWKFDTDQFDFKTPDLAMDVSFCINFYKERPLATQCY